MPRQEKQQNTARRIFYFFDNTAVSTLNSGNPFFISDLGVYAQDPSLNGLTLDVSNTSSVAGSVVSLGLTGELIASSPNQGAPGVFTQLTYTLSGFNPGSAGLLASYVGEVESGESVAFINNAQATSNQFPNPEQGFTAFANAVSNDTDGPLTLVPEFSAEFAVGSPISNSGTIAFGQRVNDNNSAIGGQELQIFVRVIPEPSSATFVILGSLFLFWRKRSIR